MFTGIVQGIATVSELEQKPGHCSFTLTLPEPLLDGLKIGASVSVDGVCLTVVRINGCQVRFDAMQETLQKTTIGLLQNESRVNIERSFQTGDEVGGHLVSGHVYGKAELISIEKPENNHVLTLRVPTEWMKYILPKGFIALDGCSLTVVDVNKQAGTFTVWLIPETLRVTGFGWKQAGDYVNIEIDARTQTIVDTVEHYLQEYNR